MSKVEVSFPFESFEKRPVMICQDSDVYSDGRFESRLIPVTTHPSHDASQSRLIPVTTLSASTDYTEILSQSLPISLTWRVVFRRLLRVSSHNGGTKMISVMTIQDSDFYSDDYFGVHSTMRPSMLVTVLGLVPQRWDQNDICDDYSGFRFELRRPFRVSSFRQRAVLT